MSKPIKDPEGRVADAFNRWMDHYIENPEKYQLQWETVVEHLGEQGQGHEPSYGKACVAMLNRYLVQAQAEEAGADCDAPWHEEGGGS